MDVTAGARALGGAALASLLVVACGRGSSTATPPSVTSPPASSTTATTATTTATATTSPALRLDPATLPSCAGHATYSTVPDWLPTRLPEGFQLSFAQSSVWQIGPVAAGPTQYLLAQADADGRLVAAITLVRGGGSYGQPGVVPQGGEVTLDEVRGRPGHVAHWVDRGDPVGRQVAEWDEAGAHWVATSALPVADLAAALAPLVLDPSPVGDPTGRFELVGRGPLQGGDPQRKTLIAVLPSAADRSSAEAITIEIRPRVAGVAGLTQLPDAGSGRLTRIGGRLLGQDQAEVVTTLADGSLVVALRNGVAIADHDLRTLVTSLARVGRDDPRLGQVPIVPDWWDLDPDLGNVFCREAG